MTTTQDAAIGFAPEATYGVAVTPTRWAEFVSETLDFRKSVKQGSGLRVGSRVARSGRRVVPTADGGGDIILEIVSKGMGPIWNACLGQSVSTLVAGTTYQQNHTLGDILPSLTLQKSLPLADGSISAYTFLGGMVSGWELDFLNADILQMKVTIDAKDVSTGVAFAPVSYVVGSTLFNFANATIYSGALTAPTPMALGIGATPIASVRGGTLVVSNGFKGDRYNIGGGGRKAKQLVGLRAITGKLDVEYADNTFRDAVLNDTPMSIVLNYTGAALSTGVETLQIIVPEVKFDGILPRSNGVDLIVVPMAYQGLDALIPSTQPIYVVCRTSDTAL